MKKLFLPLGLIPFLISISPTLAQTVTNPTQVALVCAYNSAIPAPTSGQYFFVQCDANGKLITSGGGGGGVPGGTSGQIQYNNAGAFAGFTMSGDATIVPSTGVITVTKTSGVAFGSLATLTPGTGIATALAINVGTAGAPVLYNGGGGTPTTLTLTNATGLPAATGIASGTLPAGVTINNANWSGTVLSAANGGTNCSAASITCFNNITGLTASGTTGTTSTNLVFSTSPTFITPVLGAASLTSAQFNGSLLITDAANVINQRNGTTAQGMRQYMTYTDASNGTWGYGCDWTVTANVCTMGYSGNGTGAVTGRAIIFSTNILANVLDFNYNETTAWSTPRAFVAGNNNVVIGTATDALIVSSGGRMGFSSVGAVHGNSANDTYFTRGAIAGAMNVNGTISTAGYTVAGLPAGVTGKRAYVTDQLTSCPVLSGTFTGGGAVVCSAFYNGTSWVHE